MSKETWANIPGYEGWYQVSSLGNVRSVDRTIAQGSRYGHPIERKVKGKQIIPTDNGHGYLIVGLRMNQARANHYVHRLVAEAFIGNPLHCMEINHIDYNKQNNQVTNLEWVTRAENVRHSAENMRHPKWNAKPSNTNQRYITYRRNRYILSINNSIVRYYKTYATLEEAIAQREVVMRDGKHHVQQERVLCDRGYQRS